MTTQAQHDTDPTEAFDQQCRDLVTTWQRGQLPIDALTSRLAALAQDARTSGHLANQGRVEHTQGYIRFYLGHLNASIMHYDKARSLFQRVHNKRRVAIMNLNQGEIYRYKGEFKRATRLYHTAYQMAVEVDDVNLQAMAIANEGLSLVSAKDYERAQRALYEGYRLSEAWQGDGTDLYGLRCEIDQALATIALEQGNSTTAWEHAQNALRNARLAQEKLSEGLAFRSLGDTITRLDAVPEGASFETPDDYYRAAMAAFEELDAQVEIGRTKYSMACSLAARNRRRAAANLFRDALVIFTRLGMTGDAARAAEAQLRVI